MTTLRPLYLISILTLLLALTGCDDKRLGKTPDTPDTLHTIQVEPGTISRLTLPEQLLGAKSYRWQITGKSGKHYRLESSTAATPQFIAIPGVYDFEVTADGATERVRVTVAPYPEGQGRPHPSKVYDFTPAPGQFVGIHPRYDESEPIRELYDRLLETLSEDSGLISLGGWGGSITFGFDHTVINVSGLMDLQIGGNAFWNHSPDLPEGVLRNTSGSAEPGIVQVAYDANQNGRPDDPWYEIKGSGHTSRISEYWYPFAQKAGNLTSYTPDYSITYHRPTSAEPSIVHWEDNQGKSGALKTNYPTWIEGDKITAKGTRLPQNAVPLDIIHLFAFDYGYVDNRPNSDPAGNIDLDWAVDRHGNPAHLLGIDFVRVYTGVQQQNGILGENSTELSLTTDLHTAQRAIPTLTSK